MPVFKSNNPCIVTIDPSSLMQRDPACGSQCKVVGRVTISGYLAVSYNEDSAMMRAGFFSPVAVGLSIGGCMASQEPSKTPPLKSAGANCTGHFQFDTEQSGTGYSDCRNGRGVAFSAKTQDKI